MATVARFQQLAARGCKRGWEGYKTGSRYIAIPTTLAFGAYGAGLGFVNAAFCDCTGLMSVTIPDGVTQIGYRAFEGCSGLTSVTIPDGVTQIGGGAFRGCAALSSVTIPDSVTQIGGWAFYGCTGLTTVTIPNGVTWIGEWAFRGCTGLTPVTVPQTCVVGDGAFPEHVRVLLN